MMTVYMQFEGQAAQDVTHLILDSVTIEHHACNVDLKNSQSVATIEIAEDAEIYTALLNSESNTLVQILDDDNAVFTGFIPPAVEYMSTGMIKMIRIEISDNCALLQKNIETEYVAENQPLGQICIDLLALAVITADSSLATSMPEQVRAIAIDADSNLTFYDILNQLLYEYGYALKFNAYGQFEPYKWLKSDISTSYILENSDLIEQISLAKDIFTTKSVKIGWYAVSERLNTSVYVSDIPLASDGTIEGYTVLPNTLYPPESNVGTSYLEYTADAIAYFLTADSPYDNAKADLSGILITKNHRLDIKPAFNIITQNFYNKKANISIKNTLSTNKMLYGLDIYADVTYRSARKESVALTGLAEGDTQTIETQYIATEDAATTLCSALATYRRYSRYAYNIKSDVQLSVGDVVRILTDDVDQVCYVATARYDSASQPIQSKIYEYVLRGISDAIIDVTSTSRTPTVGALDKIYQDLANGRVAIDGKPAPAIADTTPPAGGAMISATAMSDATVDLLWSAYVDNAGGSGMGGYNIYRALNSNKSDAQKIGGASPSNLAYTDNTGKIGTSYYYGVSAFDRNNNESAIAWNPTIALVQYVIAPAQPSNFAASAVRGEVLMSWKMPSEADISYYEIELSNNGAAFSVIGQSGTNSFSQEIGKIGQSVLALYKYRVRAYNIYGIFSAYDKTAGTAIADFSQYGTYNKAVLTPQLSGIINAITVSWAKQYQLLDFHHVNIQYRKGSDGLITTIQSPEFIQINNLDLDKSSNGEPTGTVYQVRLQQVSDDSSIGSFSSWVSITLFPADNNILTVDHLVATSAGIVTVSTNAIKGVATDANLPLQQRIDSATTTLNYIDLLRGQARFGNLNTYLWLDLLGRSGAPKIEIKSANLNLSSSGLVTTDGTRYVRVAGDGIDWANDPNFTNITSHLYGMATGAEGLAGVDAAKAISPSVLHSTLDNFGTAGVARVIFSGSNNLKNLPSGFFTTYDSPHYGEDLPVKEDGELLCINSRNGSDLFQLYHSYSGRFFSRVRWSWASDVTAWQELALHRATLAEATAGVNTFKTMTPALTSQLYQRDLNMSYDTTLPYNNLKYKGNVVASTFLLPNSMPIDDLKYTGIAYLETSHPDSARLGFNLDMYIITHNIGYEDNYCIQFFYTYADARSWRRFLHNDIWLPLVESTYIKATIPEAIAGADNIRIMTPLLTAVYLLNKYATNAEIDALSGTNVMTPKGVDYYNAKRSKYIRRDNAKRTF